MIFNQKEKESHAGLMLLILKKIQQNNIPLVLKGGTALMLEYNLSRFSEDIDLDSAHSSKKPRIDSILKSISGITSFSIKKQTETTRRYSVLYGDDKRLKIEISYREIADKNDFKQSELGFLVYKPQKLIEQKLNALEQRTAARDLHDIIFLLTQHKKKFNAHQINRLRNHNQNMDHLFSRFFLAYKEDDLLSENSLLKDLTALETYFLNENRAQISTVFAP